jgi:hypothetical protein
MGLVDIKWPSLAYVRAMIERFMVRELGFPCDSLDAFAGIIGVLERFMPGGFYYGLPELYFDIALLW